MPVIRRLRYLLITPPTNPQSADMGYSHDFPGATNVQLKKKVGFSTKSIWGRLFPHQQMPLCKDINIRVCNKYLYIYIHKGKPGVDLS